MNEVNLNFAGLKLAKLIRVSLLISLSESRLIYRVELKFVFLYFIRYSNESLEDWDGLWESKVRF